MTSEYSETDEPSPPPPESRDPEADDGWGAEPLRQTTRRTEILSPDHSYQEASELAPAALAEGDCATELDDGWGDDVPHRDREASGRKPPDFPTDLRYKPRIHASVDDGPTEDQETKVRDYDDEAEPPAEVGASDGADAATNENDRQERIDEARQNVAEALQREPTAREGYERSLLAREDEHETERPTETRPAGDRREHVSIAEAVANSEAHAASDIAQANEYAEQRLHVEHADYAGFDQATANEMNASLEALRTKYPEAHGLRYISTTETRNADLLANAPDFVADQPQSIIENDRIMGATLSADAGIYSGIAIGTRWANDYPANSADLEAQVESFGHPPGTGSISGVVAHEFGHVLGNDLQRWHPEIFRETVTPVLDDIAAHGKLWVYENVSAYAGGDIADPIPLHELLAEAFAEYQLSSEPREAARRIGAAIDKAYKQAYETD